MDPSACQSSHTSPSLGAIQSSTPRSLNLTSMQLHIGSTPSIRNQRSISPRDGETPHDSRSCILLEVQSVSHPEVRVQMQFPAGFNYPYPISLILPSATIGIVV